MFQNSFIHATFRATFHETFRATFHATFRATFHATFPPRIFYTDMLHTYLLHCITVEPVVNSAEYAFNNTGFNNTGNEKTQYICLIEGHFYAMSQLEI